VLCIDEKVLLEMRASEWEKYIAPFEAAHAQSDIVIKRKKSTK
jgi:hypothetical protein